MPKRTDPADDESLKRLGGGRWQTRDERFTIEPQSGTWAVADAEQTDDLGMPLVRGPFPSLTAAKEAIASARSSAPAESPLADRLAGRPAKEATTPPAEPAKATGRSGKDRPARATSDTADASEAERPKRQPEREPPTEASWISDLAASDRGRARRLIAALTDAGIADAEGIVRRDLVGGVPAIAAVALTRQLATFGDEADPVAIAAALADGRDEDLGVRWRLVDGDGRPILVEAPRRKRSR